MSLMMMGIGRWLKPVIRSPVAAPYMNNIFREFANQKHKKILKLAKGTKKKK